MRSSSLDSKQYVSIVTESRHLDEKNQNNTTIMKQEQEIQDSKKKTAVTVHETKKNKNVTSTTSTHATNSTSTESSAIKNLRKEQEVNNRNQADLNKENDRGSSRNENETRSDHITAPSFSTATTTTNDGNVREGDEATLVLLHPGASEYHDFYATYDNRRRKKNRTEEDEIDSNKREKTELLCQESRLPHDHFIGTLMEGVIDTSSSSSAYGGRKVNIKSNGNDEKRDASKNNNNYGDRVAVVVADEDKDDCYFHPSGILVEDKDAFNSRTKKRRMDCTDADSESFAPTNSSTAAATSTTLPAAANDESSSQNQSHGVQEQGGKQKESINKAFMISKRMIDASTTTGAGVMKISKEQNGSNAQASSSFDHTSITSDSDNNEDGTPASIPPTLKECDNISFCDHYGSGCNQRNSNGDDQYDLTSMIGSATNGGADDEDNLMSWWQRQQRPHNSSSSATGRGSISSTIERQPSVDSSSRSHSALLAAQREVARRTNRTNLKSDDEEVVLQHQPLPVPPPSASQMMGYPQYHNHYHPPHHPQAQPPSFSHHPAQYPQHHTRGNSFQNEDPYAYQLEDGRANIPGTQPPARNQNGTQPQVRGRNENEFSQLPALPHESRHHAENHDLHYPHPHHDPYNAVDNRAAARRSHDSLPVPGYPHEYDHHGNYIVPPPEGGSSYPHGDGSSHSSVAQMSGSFQYHQQRPSAVPPHDNNDSARIDHHHHHQEDNYNHQQMPALHDHNHLQQQHHYVPPHFPNAHGHNYPPAPPHPYQDAIPIGGGQLLPYYSRRLLPLATSDDENWLSEFLCFVRSECVEVFKATPEDVAARMNSKKVLPGQVGIRCKFCAHLPHRERTGRSSSFPSSTDRIYQSLTMMLRDHFTKCTAMPPEMRDRYLSLKANASQGATDSKRYWIDSGMMSIFFSFCF